MFRKTLAIAIGSVAFLVPAACGGGSAQTVTVTVDSSGQTSSTSVSSGSAVDAQAVVKGLQCAGLPIDRIQAFTEETDPNDNLGRPGEYVAKANWTDSRIAEKDRVGDWDPRDGGSVEVFDTQDDANKRLKYLESLSGQGILGTDEYDTLINSLTLLRVTQSLVPSDAGEYTATAHGLIDDPSQIGKNCVKQAGPPPATPQPVHATGFIGGNANPTLPPGTPGKVTVVEHGPIDRGSSTMPIVVRNMTSEPITELKVQGRVSTGGKLLLTGESQGVRPAQLGPGEIALGYVYFNGRKIPDGVTYAFTVDSTPVSNSFQTGSGDLKIDSAANTGDQIAGFATNPTTTKITGPIEMYVECFDSSEQLLSVHNTYTERDHADAHEKIAYSVDLTDFGTTSARCSHYLVAGGGFQQ